MNAEVLIKFNGDTSGVDKSTKSLTKNFSNLTKSITLGNVAAKAITKAFSVISSSMDSAISRIDTMNNFSTVMSNLGISTKDSSEVIQELSEKLTGLPTTLNSAASSVQRFTAYNGDIKKSEQYFLAVNNAILAGTNDATMQASALEQLTQAYTKGKPEMQDWKTLLQAMPAQLKQVAIAMGYVQTDDLYEALKNGEVSMEDFMDTMVQLNETGVAGFASLEEQARANTSGIATSITNMKTAFTRGVADIITKVDEALEPFGGLSGVIQQVGKYGEKAFKKIGDVLAWVIPKVIEIFQFIADHKDELILIGTIVAGWKIATIVQKGVQAFQMMKITLTLLKMEMGATNVVAGLLKFGIAGLKSGISSLSAVIAANPITILVGLLIALVAAFIYCWNNCESFRNFWIGLWEKLKETLSTWVAGFKLMWNGIKKFFKSIIDNFFKPKIQAWKDMFTGVINFFTGIFTGNWKKAFNGLKTFFKGFVNNILSSFGGLPKKMLSIGLDVVKGIGKGITSGVTWLKNRISEFVGNVTKFIKKVFKIGSPSRLMADQVGQWLPKGIGVGITANTDSVYNAMDNMEKEMMSSYGLSPQLTNSTALHYSPNVNVINNVDVSTDPIGQTVSRIKTFSGGARNDYNYGMGA